jgi:hypothetical protein
MNQIWPLTSREERLGQTNACKKTNDIGPMIATYSSGALKGSDWVPRRDILELSLEMCTGDFQVHRMGWDVLTWSEDGRHETSWNILKSSR